MRFDRKVAVVTGAGQGIRRVIACAFAQRGARVVAADIKPDRAEAVAAEICHQGGSAMYAVVDVSDEASTGKMIDLAAKRFGGVDTLVNNAAISERIVRRPLTDIPVAEWDRMMAVNVRGPWLCARAVLPYMRERGGGRIVNIASDIAIWPTLYMDHYTVSKCAVITLTRALAREFGAWNITVNALAPGYTLTGTSLHLAEAAVPGAEQRMPDYLAMRCLRRDLYPEDTAAGVLFLASDHARMITGQIHLIKGGNVFL